MSDRRTDPKFLLEKQYRTKDNLEARIALHERFSTNPYPFPRWVFDAYAFGDDADVLEVGCGNGMIWRENLDRIPDGWRLTLTDFSPGMVEAARGVLGERAGYAVADVQELPFDDGSFDAVIANHVLFHVPDRPRALGEIARVLRPGGLLVGTTIGRDHFRELRELLGRENVIWSESRERFGLETAPAQLERVFAAVEIDPYPDAFEITEAEPLVEFVRSLDVPGLNDGDLDVVRQRVSAGPFHITKATGRFRCRKP